MRKTLVIAAFLCAAALGAAPQSSAPKAAVRDLAPTGKLRAAINLVNTVLVQRNAAGGDATGISIALANELARRLDVPLEMVFFEGAGKEFDAAQTGAWDIGFFAIDPKRAQKVDFTAPYVEFDGGYMVRIGSPVRTIADVDKPGTRVAVGKDSVYDLYLTSKLKHAQLVRFSPASMNNVVQHYREDALEVAAFIKIPLAAYAGTHPGYRMVRGSFMDIDQAIATPKGTGLAGKKYLRAFVEEMKNSGFIEDFLQRTGATDVSVAPPAQDEMGHNISPAAMKCELLPPWFRSDDTKVVQEKIGPNEASPTGNSYFFITRPVMHVIVHIEPTSSDTAPYVVKLISRYTDDTIYEPVVETIYPKAGQPYKWGPIEVQARKVPQGKVADAFNVKVQENYAMDPNAKGFTYKVWVEGCN